MYQTSTTHSKDSNHHQDRDSHTYQTSQTLEQPQETYHTNLKHTQIQSQEQEHTTHGSETHGTNNMTLQQLVPLWTSVLARTPKTSEIRFKVRNFYIDISKCDRCIVGEAHNWDSVYDHCIDCYQMSLEFASILRDNPVIRKPQLDKFVEHFNSKHL